MAGKQVRETIAALSKDGGLRLSLEKIEKMTRKFTDGDIERLRARLEAEVQRRQIGRAQRTTAPVPSLSARESMKRLGGLIEVGG